MENNVNSNEPNMIALPASPNSLLDGPDTVIDRQTRFQRNGNATAIEMEGECELDDVDIHVPFIENEGVGRQSDDENEGVER